MAPTSGVSGDGTEVGAGALGEESVMPPYGSSDLQQLILINKVNGQRLL